jgi:hypothetical protein
MNLLPKLIGALSLIFKTNKQLSKCVFFQNPQLKGQAVAERKAPPGVSL